MRKHIKINIFLFQRLSFKIHFYFIKLFLVLFFILQVSLFPQTEKQNAIVPFFSDDKKNQIQAYVNEQIQSTGIVGASYILVEHGEIVSKNSINLLDYPYLENKALPLGTLSRILITLAAYKLREEDKLRFENKVLDYLPNLKLGSYEKEDSLLIKHIINGTSGLNLKHDKILHLQPLGVYFKPNQLLAILKELDYNQYPSVLYEDSHLNYFLLSEVLASATGKPFFEFINKDFLIPLEMDFFYEVKRFRKEGVPIYDYFFSSRAKTNPEESAEVFAPSNRVFGKMEDIGKLISLLLGEYKTEFLSPYVMREIFSSQTHIKQDESKIYGGGFIIETQLNTKLAYANLNGKGSCGSIYLYPEHKAGFGIFFPIEAEPACHNIAKEISNILLGIPAQNAGVISKKTLTLFCFFLILIATMSLFYLSYKFDRFFSMLPHEIGDKKEAARNFLISLVLFVVLLWFEFLIYPNSSIGLKFTSLPYTDTLWGWLPELFYSFILITFIVFFFGIYYGFELMRASGEDF